MSRWAADTSLSYFTFVLWRREVFDKCHHFRTLAQGATVGKSRENCHTIVTKKVLTKPVRTCKLNIVKFTGESILFLKTKKKQPFRVAFKIGFLLKIQPELYFNQFKKNPKIAFGVFRSWVV